MTILKNLVSILVLPKVLKLKASFIRNRGTGVKGVIQKCCIKPDAVFLKNSHVYLFESPIACDSTPLQQRIVVEPYPVRVLAADCPFRIIKTSIIIDV